MIELRHLRTLIALRESGSLVEAAERLHLTQSALSHQIKDLENRLDTSLFLRKTKPVRFTAAGQRLLTLADDVLPIIKNTERDLKKLSGGTAGRLHMAIECHSCFQWLVPALDIFRDHWPEVELDLSSGFNFAPLPALARGDLDLVITSDPINLKGLSYVPLFRYQAMLAIARQHWLADKDFIRPNNLEKEILITYPIDRQRLDIFIQFLDPANVEPAQIRTAELTPMMIQLAASLRGVCCLPNWVLTEYLEKAYIIAKPLGSHGLYATLYAAIREEHTEAAFMHDFLKTAQETCFKTLTGIHTAKQSLDTVLLNK